MRKNTKVIKIILKHTNNVLKKINTYPRIKQTNYYNKIAIT